MGGRGGGGATARLLSLPVIAVLALVATLYYTTVFVLLDELADLGTRHGQLHSSVFSFLTVMCFASFLTAVLTDPGRVPSSFVPEMEDPQRDGIQLKFCDKCSTYKPSRTHHCRICRRCTLKMDHHCLWINNCVGHRNYKSFVIFVLYATSASVYSMVVFVWDLIQKDRDFTGKLLLKLLYLVFGLVTIFLSLVLGSLLGWHIYLISRNMTTIEYRGAARSIWLAKKGGQPYTHPFDVGLNRNISIILGSNMLKWFWPWATGVLNNGMQFPMNNAG